MSTILLEAIFRTFIAAFLLFSIYLIYRYVSHIYTPLYKGKKSDHFDGKRFFLPDFFNTPQKTSKKVTKIYYIKKLLSLYQHSPHTQDNAPFSTPYTIDHIPDLSFSIIEKTTLLIKWQNITILIDPTFSKHTLNNIHPQIPNIDVILLTNNLPNHLDIATLHFFEKRDLPLIITGLGNEAYLEKFDFINVKECEWWGHETIQNFQIFFTPSKHHAGRSFLDSNRSLWGSFVIKNKDYQIFISGDTGYSKHFNSICNKYGAADLAFLSMAPSNTTEQEIHLTAHDIIKAHMDLQSKQSVLLSSKNHPNYKITNKDMQEAQNRLKIKENFLYF